MRAGTPRTNTEMACTTVNSSHQSETARCPRTRTTGIATNSRARLRPRRVPTIPAATPSAVSKRRYCLNLIRKSVTADSPVDDRRPAPDITSRSAGATIGSSNAIATITRAVRTRTQPLMRPKTVNRVASSNSVLIFQLLKDDRETTSIRAFLIWTPWEVLMATNDMILHSGASAALMTIGRAKKGNLGMCSRMRAA